MIIGRAPAPSGAIKIKKNEEGVPRVVSCGCCQSCACGSIPLSSLEPTFAKQLSGDDPEVAPFTQVVVSYFSRVGLSGGPFPAVSWVDGTDCGLKKYADFVIPTEDQEPEDIYPSFVGCGVWQRPDQTFDGYATLSVYLTANNCLVVSLGGDAYGASTALWNQSCNNLVAPPGDEIITNTGSIIINGVARPSYIYIGQFYYDWMFEQDLSVVNFTVDFS